MQDPQDSLRENFAVPSQSGHAGLGELMQPGEIRAASGNERGGIVADGVRMAVTLERELGD